MGCFDGYLICSDYDGTFFCGEEPSENIAAVKYFIQNGGRFCFATGRTEDFIKRQGLFDIVNAPVCTYNGAVVYDTESEQVVCKSYSDFTVAEFFDALQDIKELLKEFYIYTDTDICISGSDFGEVDSKYLNEHTIKTVCVFETNEAANAFKEYILKHKTFKNSYISKSWHVGVEINAIDGTKGSALQFIKEYLGNIHTAIGVGDYENDIPMIEKADIGVAVGNALDSVKQAADRVIVPCTDNAIKFLIENLPQNK